MTNVSMIQKKNQDINMGFSLLFFSYVGYKALEIKKNRKAWRPTLKTIGTIKESLSTESLGYPPACDA